MENFIIIMIFFKSCFWIEESGVNKVNSYFNSSWWVPTRPCRTELFAQNADPPWITLVLAYWMRSWCNFNSIHSYYLTVVNYFRSLSLHRAFYNSFLCIYFSSLSDLRSSYGRLKKKQCSLWYINLLTFSLATLSPLIVHGSILWEDILKSKKFSIFVRILNWGSRGY